MTTKAEVYLGMVDRKMVVAALAELADPNYVDRFGGPLSDGVAAFEACTRKLFEESGLDAALGRDWGPSWGGPFARKVFSKTIDSRLRLLRMLAPRVARTAVDPFTTYAGFAGCRSIAVEVLPLLAEPE